MYRQYIIIAVCLTDKYYFKQTMQYLYKYTYYRFYTKLTKIIYIIIFYSTYIGKYYIIFLI